MHKANIEKEIFHPLFSCRIYIPTTLVVIISLLSFTTTLFFRPFIHPKKQHKQKTISHTTFVPLLFFTKAFLLNKSFIPNRKHKKKKNNPGFYKQKIKKTTKRVSFHFRTPFFVQYMCVVTTYLRMSLLGSLS